MIIYGPICAGDNQLWKHGSVLEIEYQGKTVAQYIARDKSWNWRHNSLWYVFLAQILKKFGSNYVPGWTIVIRELSFEIIIATD